MLSLNSKEELLLLLLLLSRFSRVRLCATPQTPPSLGFSRQEHWSGLPFPSPMRESEIAQSCPTLCDPKDYSPPGSSLHGIFQARVLEWGATAFSKSLVQQRLKFWSWTLEQQVEKGGHFQGKFRTTEP